MAQVFGGRLRRIVGREVIGLRRRESVYCLVYTSRAGFRYQERWDHWRTKIWSGIKKHTHTSMIGNCKLLDCHQKDETERMSHGTFAARHETLWRGPHGFVVDVPSRSSGGCSFGCIEFKF